eukprot:CAMPEP_0194073872 /NCGR_PEP_ID=MMETSP0149-20130528/1102_1 /TAXON_ID=122233 /ORGANISM="Chaetoceros debilis, Strain MM31A-1" /LENGTH=425 /DNA_ID=CAMNT_0038753923 /DNA_START=214 /DNA_END=1491 /DNA_ORIENTATION=+
MTVENITNGMKEWSLEDMSAEAKTAMSKKEKAILWGRPGYLTTEEVKVYSQFREWLLKQDQTVKNTVYSFTEAEGEVWTLTRWLRARKYVLANTIAMVNEATAERADPRKADYYPDAYVALGVDPSIYVSQYPQLYAGFSKDGCPVFYSKPGRLNIDAVEAITTIPGILNYHWHIMQHDYTDRMLKYKEEHPDFTRFECVSVLDLDKLTLGQLGSRTLDIIKKQAFIDSLCFPETMNKMVIVNAPRFFSATWGVIKGFLDARTSAKVEIFSSMTAAKAKLREIISDDNLPSDYGGTAESTTSILAREAASGKSGRDRLLSEVIYVRSTQSLKFTLEDNEEVDIYVYTKAIDGANFRIMNSSKKELAPSMKVKHTGSTSDKEQASVIHLNPAGRVSGVKEIKIKAESLKTRMSSEAYLVVVNFYKK